MEIISSTINNIIFGYLDALKVTFEGVTYLGSMEAMAYHEALALAACLWVRLWSP
jgi:hypothetical protein